MIKFVRNIEERLGAAILEGDVMQIQKTPTAITPRYADVLSAGMDLYIDTAENYILQPGETYRLPTGIRVLDMPKNHFMALYPQPGLYKKGLQLCDSPNIINSSNLGEIVLGVKNIFADIIRINGQWGLKCPIAIMVLQNYRFVQYDISEWQRS